MAVRIEFEELKRLIQEHLKKNCTDETKLHELTFNAISKLAPAEKFGKNDVSRAIDELYRENEISFIHVPGAVPTKYVREGPWRTYRLDSVSSNFSLLICMVMMLFIFSIFRVIGVSFQDFNVFFITSISLIAFYQLSLGPSRKLAIWIDDTYPLVVTIFTNKKLQVAFSCGLVLSFLAWGYSAFTETTADGGVLALVFIAGATLGLEIALRTGIISEPKK